MNIRAHDIVDGNNKLTLGLVWTIILHFQVSRFYCHVFPVVIVVIEQRFLQPVARSFLSRNQQSIALVNKHKHENCALNSLKLGNYVINFRP